MQKTYKIIRFSFNGPNRTLQKGLTLAQAQAHCKDEKTAGDGWFDGYERDQWGFKHRSTPTQVI
tara:strand:- start:300 stop:491 length:192 start_codon:yes stop_codon:yes gene_type:complete